MVALGFQLRLSSPKDHAEFSLPSVSNARLGGPVIRPSPYQG